MPLGTKHASFPANSRLESIDILRGIAALAVLLFHYTAPTSIQLQEGNPLRLIGVYGHFGVDIFFVISGFIIAYSMYSIAYRANMMGTFLLKRIIRIELPYLALIIVEILLILLSYLTPWRTEPSTRLESFNFLSHITYLNDLVDVPWLIPIFWTLAIEFQFYLLIAIIFPLLVTTKISIRLATVALFVLLSFILPQPQYFFKYAPIFLSGILVFQRWVGLIDKKEFAASTLTLAVVLAIQHGLFPMVLVLLTITAILYLNWNSKATSFLGMISYSLYLVHIPFGGRLLVLTELYVHSESLRTLLILLYLPLTMFVAWLFYEIVEKPSVRLSKRLVYRKVKQVSNPD